MKKLLFVGFAVLGFSEMSEKAWGMNDPFRTESMSGSNSVTRAEFSERERIRQGHDDDMRQQADMFQSQISNLTSQVSNLTQLIQNLTAQVSVLTDQNKSLRSERDALGQQLAEFKDSTEQKQLEATERANALRQQELERAKATEAAKNARRNEINQRISVLLRNRASENKYVTGEIPSPARYVYGCLQNADEVEKYKQRQRQASSAVSAIDAELASLNAELAGLR